MIRASFQPKRNRNQIGTGYLVDCFVNELQAAFKEIIRDYQLGDIRAGIDMRGARLLEIGVVQGNVTAQRIDPALAHIREIALLDAHRSGVYIKGTSRISPHGGIKEGDFGVKTFANNDIDFIRAAQ